MGTRLIVFSTIKIRVNNRVPGNVDEIIETASFAKISSPERFM
jgi:hypothetical protein